MTGTLRKGKYFTPAEANKALPLVKRIVSDILATSQVVKDGREDGKYIDESGPEYQAAVDRLHELFSEIEKIGCSYRDWSFSMGLVDFPSIIDGQDVLLCWRSDEEKVEFYHGMFAGYAGRKPIPQAYLSEVTTV